MIFDSKSSLRTVCKSVDGCPDPSTGTPDPSTGTPDSSTGKFVDGSDKPSTDLDTRRRTSYVNVASIET